MKKGYRISTKAIKDLEQIWLYTLDAWSKEQADRYHELLMEEINYVSRYFERARSAEHIRKGYRSSKVKSHIIFFRQGKDSLIEVVRILHERMDIANRLK